MSAAAGFVKVAAICVFAAMLGACATSYPTRTTSYKETPLDRPAAQPADSELFSVRIEAFDPGTLPLDPNVAKGLSPEIRNGESYFIPVQLKNTMQKSGHWGTVRVVPKGGREGEVAVLGKILESDGEILKLEIEAKDATGVLWFRKSYESIVDAAAYRKAESGGVDAFQDLYNQIANDLAAHKKALKPEDATAIRQVAELKFGADFAPNHYNAYLSKGDSSASQQEDGLQLQKLLAMLHNPQGSSTRKADYTVVRLPSEDDPIVQRVNRIRTREEFLVDTLDQQYDMLALNVREPYTQWRNSRLKEIAAIREADRIKNEEQAKAVAVGVIGIALGAALASQNRGGNCYGCTTAGVAVAGAAVAIGVQMAIQASEQASAETSLRKAALEEMGTSLATDIKPTVIEVEGKTVELKGSVEEKFKAWRDLLQEMRDNETAPLPAAPVASTS